MIEFTRGNILAADAEALVNTVNCVGIMGRGIALQFKQMFPANFKAYAAACAADLVQPGRMFVFETRALSNPRYIVNFPTKRHWRGNSRIEDIESGLVALVGEIRTRNIRSVAIPPLGSGLGGLAWSDVRPLIVSALEAVPDLRVIVYEPSDERREAVASKPAPKMTPGRAALVALMHRYLSGLMDPFVSLLEVHKLMYFMQEAGQGLRLKYTKGIYGPYAENLRHVLADVEGHLVVGYGDGGDAPEKQLKLVPGAVVDAETLLRGDAEVAERFGRVGRLVDGFETPFGLELLATVHWVASRETSGDMNAVIAAVHGWSARKRMFEPEQIALAHATLSEQGWLG